jgi:hypothetical protein
MIKMGFKYNLEVIISQAEVHSELKIEISFGEVGFKNR